MAGPAPGYAATSLPVNVTRNISRRFFAPSGKFGMSLLSRKSLKRKFQRRPQKAFLVFNKMRENTPSSTAMIVAKNIAVVAASNQTVHFVAPEAARLNSLLIKKSSAGGEHFLRNASCRWFQNLFHLYERLTIRGLALHQAL